MKTEKYNGWSNRATWNLALWLDQDWGCELVEWRRDHKGIKGGEDLRRMLEDAIADMELRCWYLPDMSGEPLHYLTPDAERFDDVDWDEVFDHLIQEPRDEQAAE